MSPQTHQSPDDYDRFLCALRQELRARREAHGLSAYALAKRARVTDQTILNIEQGLGSPNLHSLYHIAQALGLPLAELLQSVDQRRNGTR